MGSLRRSAMVVGVGGLLVAAALYAWQRSGQAAHGEFSSFGQFRTAYARVVLGMPAARLASLGFDRTRPGARTLSYLGTMEFLMPKNSRDFDRLNPAVLSCLAAADRCGAYVFHLDGGASRKEGMFDFAAHAAAPEGARAVFLVKRGRVAYKAMMGR